MSRQISPERQAAYYFGMVLTIIGVVLFFSVFFTGISHFGDFSNFEGQARSEMTRAFSGMILIVIGQLIMRVGERGAAGSGAILDPEQAREDLEPYSRQAGGMVKDALDEADINLGARDSETVVKVRCRSCGTLNEEDARFCKECANPL